MNDASPADRVFADDVEDAELARIAADADDALVDELTATIAGAAGDADLIRRRAAALERFAAFLAAGLRDPAAAEASLRLAAVALDHGGLDEARERAERIVARLDPVADPDRSAWAQTTLGLVAREQARVRDAVTHWDRAAELWDRVDAPRQAAFCAASAASLVQSAPDAADRADAAELRDRWRAASELSERAADDAGGGDAAMLRSDARISGTNASVYAIRVLEAVAPQDWDPSRLRDEALAARAFALRCGADHEAAHLVFFVIVALSDLGAPLEEIRSWAAVAHSAYDALDHDAEVVAGWRARIDFAEGNAALIAGDPLAAEPPLRRALAQLEREGDDDRAAAVRHQLLSIVYAGAAGGDERAAEAFRTADASGADRAATVSHMAEVRAREAGNVADADRHHRRTRALLLKAGEPVKALGVDLEHAMWGLRHGSTVALRSALAAARVHLDDPPPGSGGAPLRWLAIMAVTARGALAEHLGDHAGSLAVLQELEALQLAAGSGVLAARTAVHRGRLLWADGDADGTFQAVLPAALALDAVRFMLPDAGRRRRSAGVAAEGFALACRSAAALGLVRELAELLEVMRGASRPKPSAAPADSLDDLLARTARELMRGEPGPGSAGGIGATAAGHGVGPVVNGVGTAVPGTTVTGADRTTLGLPARLWTPWRTPALAEPLQRARTYLDPIRADVVVSWSVPALTAGPGDAAGG